MFMPFHHGRGLAMPLSEHEQRLLDQMERALYAEDPKFATSLRSANGVRASRGRAALGVLGVLVGLGLILAGVSSTMIALGVGGFALMLIGAVIAYSAFRVPSASVDQEPGAQAPAAQHQDPKSSGFMDRLEDRWRKRNEEGGP
jgi:predicted lipid-binding transport protein (Tim44 family)